MPKDKDKTPSMREKKPKRAQKVRTPRESTSLVVGIFSLILAALAVIMLIVLGGVAAAILGGCAIVAAFVTFILGKGGTLFAVVGLIAGFMTILSYLVTLALGNA